MNPVPSVATNDGSRSVTVRNALTQPTPPPTMRIARMMPRMPGTPSYWMRKYMMNGANA